MLQVNFIRDNKERVIKGLETRNYPQEEYAIVDEIIHLDDLRKSTQTSLDQILAKRNQLSKSIGGLFKQGKKEEAEALRNEVNQLKERAAQLDQGLNEAKEQLQELLYRLPNVPHPSVPPGKEEEDNEVFKAWNKELPDLGSKALPHLGTRE